MCRTRRTSAWWARCRWWTWAGSRCAPAHRGPEAIAAAAAFAPDLILLDVMMPGMDGPSVLRALRALPELAAVPAIFMTAKIMAAEIAGLKGEGALEVVAKPFEPMTVPDEIRAIWSRAP